MKKQNKKAAIKPEHPVYHPPVNLVLPNTIESKMQAILHVSRAVEELAKAINSVNLQAHISGNVIHSAPGGTGISIGGGAGWSAS